MHPILPEDVRETTPTLFVIFGATGDLALSKLLPALYDLFVKGKLPLRFEIIAFARRPFTNDTFRALANEQLVKKGKPEGEPLKDFLRHIRFAQGFFDTLDSYEKLGATLLSIDEKEFGACSNKLFYLAVPPNFYESIIMHLSSSGLTVPCSDSTGWTRVLIEKPFGNNLSTAERLDMLLGKLFKEEQIFRIDHYLAKETIQNILAFRFSNGIFESLWSKEHIHMVEFELYESNTVGGRGSFYDAVGALRDVGQNHMLQMFALIAMERPKSLTPHDVRIARSDALESLKGFSKKELQEKVSRKRYKGFLNEVGVAKDSQTETYFAIEAHSTAARWKGVPFILRSGKGLSRSETRISIFFKDAEPLFKHEGFGEGENILTFRIQPNEGIDVTFAAKKSGNVSIVEKRILSFNYRDVLNGAKTMDAYEKVLVDAVRGDQTLFMSTAEMKAEWKFIMPILDEWKDLPLEEYERGSTPESLKNISK